MDIKNCDGFQYLSEINDESIDLIITDPPYIISSETGMGNLHKQIQKNKENNIDFVKSEEDWNKVKHKYIDRKDTQLNPEKMKENYLKYGTIYGKKSKKN